LWEPAWQDCGSSGNRRQILQDSHQALTRSEKSVSGLQNTLNAKPANARKTISLPKPKIVKKCALPLTGEKVVHRIITELAVFDIDSKGLILRKKADDISIEDLQKITEPKFRIELE
jgi:acyl CoA:acetate/3-ketoacid CoA transferase beta subunit